MTAYLSSSEVRVVVAEGSHTGYTSPSVSSFWCRTCMSNGWNYHSFADSLFYRSINRVGYPLGSILAYSSLGATQDESDPETGAGFDGTSWWRPTPQCQTCSFDASHIPFRPCSCAAIFAIPSVSQNSNTASIDRKQAKIFGSPPFPSSIISQSCPPWRSTMKVFTSVFFNGEFPRLCLGELGF